MAESRGVTNRSLSLLPLLVMGASHFSLPPLQQMFELEPRLMYGWYLTALVIGVVVYRRSGVVKDFEYNVQKRWKIKHVYEAEEQGVWATNAHLDATMSPSTKHGLSRSVSEISGESPEMELGDEAKVEVQMLSEADHIVKANARVTAALRSTMKPLLEQSAPTGESVPWTVSLTPSLGCLESTAKLSVRPSDGHAFDRQRRLHPHGAASVAPLRLNKGKDDSEVNMTSMSDSGGVETVISTSGRSRRVSGTGQRQGCTNRVGIAGKHGNDGTRSTCGVGRIGNRIDVPWLRHAGGTQRPVLSPLWLGPLTDRREVESRSPVVVSEDGSMSEKRDYYDVLGVEKSASAGDLKNAFRRLARKYHPDRSTEEDAEDRFKEIQEAYAVLSDEQKRAQ